ncbi:protein prenylyltransferase [Didymella exigua CBS 183.55]|uniref:Protein prenylyltransferase n=1 Tax=Didymella exigua CBS 183.55 TaxID=1150837 RepID=A0A6A5RK25_9PLEO|nr:protein prenylyltransferase [Didymella exigua CBS 183.55]KAF1928725.1 protein prenylyltransferase [Didymella exigua CBS 183.55]
MAHSELPAVEQQQHMYESLCRYFDEHENEVIEIEVLPSAIEPTDGALMQDGLSLGIPKKTLTLAFLAARQAFFDNKDNSPIDPKALQATKVMLLFDPELITAANFRKRRLLAMRDVEDVLTCQRALMSELCFLDSILTSPLHRQTKSPTLWWHRSWLLQLVVRVELKSASGKRIATIISAGLESVCKSGERHPKNYFAWQYARWMIVAVSRVLAALDAHIAFDCVVSAFSDRVCNWCLKHPSDISGWLFLLFLLARLDPVDERDEIVEKVLQYAAKVRSENESLWVFIRNALANPTLLEDRDARIETLEECLEDAKTTQQDSAYLEYVEQSLRWIRTSGKSKSRP